MRPKYAAMAAIAILCILSIGYIIADSEESDAETIITIDIYNEVILHGGLGWTNPPEFDIPTGAKIIIEGRSTSYATYYIDGPLPTWIVQTGTYRWEITTPPLGKTAITALSTTNSSNNTVSQVFYIQGNGEVRFDYGGGTGTTAFRSLSTYGEAMNLPAAAKPNAAFSGWYTHPTGGTRVGGSGERVVFHWAQSMTYYAQYTNNSVQFLVGGLSTIATQNTVQYGGYLQQQFETSPNTATVTIQNNPTQAPLTLSKASNSSIWTLAGNITNVLPGTYYITLLASAQGYSDCVLTIQVNVAVAIIEPITQTIFVGQTWFHQITTIPTSAQISKGLSSVTDAQGQAISPGTDYAWDAVGRSLHIQFFTVGTYYVNLVITANGYTPATKQIILNVVPMISISGLPTAAGITATPNNQVDGGWYFVVDQPQNYHYLVWNFGDGSPQASETSVTHQYTRNGTFLVTCTLYNNTNGQQYAITETVAVTLSQQIGTDAWEETPYSFAVSAPGSDPVTMTTDINQGWLSITTYMDGGVRFAKIYSDTGPFVGLSVSNPDLTVTIWSGSSMVMTMTIHIWPKVGESLISQAQYGFSLSVVGMTVTLTNTGSTAASYIIVSWGDTLQSRINMTSGTGTHTYSSPGTYTVRGDFMANGGAQGLHTVPVRVPSNSVEYSVYYDGNGGLGDISPSAGQSITVASNTFVRDGYNFIAWNTSSDGSGTVFVPGSLINSLNEDLTLYAIWSGGGGGGGSGGGGSITDKLSDKYFGVPLWAWIVLILIIIAIIAIIKEVFE